MPAAPPEPEPPPPIRMANSPCEPGSPPSSKKRSSGARMLPCAATRAPAATSAENASDPTPVKKKTNTNEEAHMPKNFSRSDKARPLITRGP